MGDNGLVLGPLMRYVDDTSAGIWVETSGPAIVSVHAGGQIVAAPDIPGARAPLRARRGRGARAGQRHALRRAGGRRRGVAAHRLAVPAQRDRDPEAGQAAAAGLRLVPHQRAARRGGQPDPRGRRAACAGRPDGRRGRRPLAGPGAVPRRPGLRRRDVGADAGVHRLPPRHRRAAGRGAQGLRGVRPPLLAGLDGPGDPVAALDAAERDDLRRPRHPRRLEHLDRVEEEDGRHQVVAPAADGRARVVLGLPARREPLPRGARGGPAVAAAAGVRRRR